MSGRRSLIIAYDLGTGGIKASLYDEAGTTLASSFMSLETSYPHDRWHEQRPMDWWNGVCLSTRALLARSGAAPDEIRCLGLSGHSLVAAPLSAGGDLLAASVPIWSDTRASEMCERFFDAVPYDRWYMTTGNGDPPETYSFMKLMWMREHMKDVFDRTDVALGSKDFINYMLTGERCTDPSYASGSGVFDLRKWEYAEDLIRAAGLPRGIFPRIRPSDEIIGAVTQKAADATGLKMGTLVACGGVDNSCMAMGARGVGEGRTYTSLGSSSWIAVTSKTPVLDARSLPFVFAHVRQGYYTSAFSIFSAGSSLRWVRDQLCRDIAGNEDAYHTMSGWAAAVPVGSHGVLFNPSLAGGSSQDKSTSIRGSYMGISLSTTREDLVRATMEGVALNLRLALDELRRHTTIGDEMLLCGGGSRSGVWRQIFADVYNLRIVKTSVDQDAASLGAAALAARGAGLWDGDDMIDKLHRVESVENPIPENKRKYENLLDQFKQWSDSLSDAGERMRHFRAAEEA